MDIPASRLQQVLGESLTESLRTPPPPHTPRCVHGGVRFPGKATAVFGMRRTGKTTLLHQTRSEVITGDGSPAPAPYLSFEDERLTLDRGHLPRTLPDGVVMEAAWGWMLNGNASS